MVSRTAWTKKYAKVSVPRKRGMNGLESAWAQELELQKRAGAIQDWAYEPLKLRLADRTYLTPDFMVIEADGTLRFDECKGFMREDAAVKLKCCAERYPYFRFARVRRKGKQWQREEI